MTTATKEHPILFSGPMVQAILDGRKTVTRRVVKPQPEDDIDDLHGGEFRDRAPYDLECNETGLVYGYGFECEDQVWKCPYGRPGDRLWVREAWRLTCDTDAVCCVAYRADGAALHYLCDNGGEGDPTELAGPAGELWDVDEAKWKTSIHMPRWASRITLEVKSVRVERLQEITEAEAKAEGITKAIVAGIAPGTFYRAGFAQLWDNLSADRGYSWESNPWVWRVEFSRLIGG